MYSSRSRACDHCSSSVRGRSTRPFSSTRTRRSPEETPGEAPRERESRKRLPETATRADVREVSALPLPIVTRSWGGRPSPPTSSGLVRPPRRVEPGLAVSNSCKETFEHGISCHQPSHPLASHVSKLFWLFRTVSGVICLPQRLVFPNILDSC